MVGAASSVVALIDGEDIAVSAVSKVVLIVPALIRVAQRAVAE
jgi:hypothetical protein